VAEGAGKGLGKIENLISRVHIRDLEKLGVVGPDVVFQVTLVDDGGEGEAGQEGLVIDLIMILDGCIKAGPVLGRLLRGKAAEPDPGLPIKVPGNNGKGKDRGLFLVLAGLAAIDRGLFVSFWCDFSILVQLLSSFPFSFFFFFFLSEMSLISSLRISLSRPEGVQTGTGLLSMAVRGMSRKVPTKKLTQKEYDAGHLTVIEYSKRKRDLPLPPLPGTMNQRRMKG